MKVLITGGAGFVGRRFTSQLLKSGMEVYCVDSLIDGGGGISPDLGWPLFDPRKYKNFHFIEKDCRAYFHQKDSPKFDLVLHLAALVGGRKSIEDTPLEVAQNLSIDSQFWFWAIDKKPTKIICFSSSAVYPIELQMQKGHLLKETDANSEKFTGTPDQTYGWAKLTHEYLAQLAVKKYDLDVITYRPFSGYGEDQNLNYPFPRICKRALETKNGAALEIWGTGEQVRDFIYIDDIVKAVLNSMNRLRAGTVLNLSSGIGTSFNELLGQIGRNLNKNFEAKYFLGKPQGVFCRVGDTSNQRAADILTTVSLEEGIGICLEHLKSTN
jgi:GDP-L-fucose synthase